MTDRTRNILRALAVAGLMSGTAAWAGDKPIYAPAPGWVKPAPPIDPAKAGADAPLLLITDQQQRIEAGQVWKYIETAIRIPSSELLSQAGTIKLPWQPADGDLIIHRVTIVRGSEQIDLLGKGERFTVLRREEQLEALQLNGLLTATMAAEGLRVGDVLRIAYSTTETDRALKGAVQTTLGLASEPMRIGFARARLLWRADTPLKWKTYRDGIVAKAVDVGDYRELDIAVPLAKPPELPTDMPLRLLKPPIIEATSFADWPAVSATMAPLYATDGLIAPGSPLAGEVDKIAKASSDPQTRAAMALQLVQDQVRYLFKGMDGGNYVPQAPAQTWSARYGDCKAKTLLLLAILRALRIEAEPVLANLSLGALAPERLPAPMAFDHVLVRATIGGEGLWLDGTGGGARQADLSDTPPLDFVLPVRIGGAALMALPKRPPARPNASVLVEVDQTAGIRLPTPYTVTIVLRGAEASLLATAVPQLGADQRKEMLQSIVGRFVDVGQPIDQSVRYDTASGTATLVAHGIAASAWSEEQKRFGRSFDYAVGQLAFEPDRTRPAWTDIPVGIGGGASVAYTTRLRLPDGGRGFALDGDNTLPDMLAGVKVRRRTALADGVVIVEDRVDAVGGEVAPADIAAVRSRLALAKTRLIRVLAPSVYPARWQLVRDARDGGRLKALDAGYAAAVAADSTHKQPFENRANYRLGVFNFRGAIADLDRVIAIEPAADGYVRRGGLHRSLGDKPRALADALAARKLDPGEARAIGLLAVLQADSGQIDAALTLLDERIAAGGKERGSFLSMKADVLGRAGRAEAAVATIDQAVSESPGNPGLLNLRCWTKGTLNVSLDTGLKDCTKSIELGESPAAAYDSRALIYYRMGRLDDASADLEAALDIEPSLGASLFMRGIIHRRRNEAALAAADLEAARMMAPGIDADYARWGIKP